MVKKFKGTYIKESKEKKVKKKDLFHRGSKYVLKNADEREFLKKKRLQHETVQTFIG